jgi:hypothetical protein
MLFQSRLLAMAVPLVPQFLLCANMTQYVNALKYVGKKVRKEVTSSD